MGHFKRLSEDERERISSLKRQGYRIVQIARIMNRSQPCIVAAIYGSVATKPKAKRPIPNFRPPKTGSDSGFIRPIDFSRLVAGR